MTRRLDLFFLGSLVLALTWGACSNPMAGILAESRVFPKGPVAAGGVLPGLEAALAIAFQSAAQFPAGGPCLSEPTIGALYPYNFTPPLFEWIPSEGGQDIFELSLRVDSQTNDYVVYTDQTSYTLPDEIWSGLARDSRDHDVVITIRGGRLAPEGIRLIDGAHSGSRGPIHIAPVDAGGAIVYWTTSPGTALKGFRIGDKQVRTILSPTLISAAGKETRCIGCHTSSPDGLLAFFGRADPQYSVDARLVDGTGGAAPASQVSANALTNLSRVDQDLPTLTMAHYNSADAVVITSLNHADTGGKWELVYTDLHAQTGGTGVIARTGDSKGAATPFWSHSGLSLVYTSTTAIANARLDAGDGDLWIVPYNDGSGGPAQALDAANDPTFNQYYPAYSARDTVLAFDRNPRGHQMYNSADGEIWVMATAGGGMPLRVPANDPPACTGQLSPGLTNSWPRWSPTATTVNGKHYYWLVFSSRRRPIVGLSANPPQLYLSAVVTIDGPEGEVIDQLYPAVYIPTQPPDESNHTPVWDQFSITAG